MFVTVPLRPSAGLTVLADLALFLAVLASHDRAGRGGVARLPALRASRRPHTPLPSPWGGRAVSAPAAAWTTPITSVADGRCHRVTDDAFAAARVARSGRCAALCGHRVVAAALVCPPGPDCQGCATVALASAPRRTGRGRHRTGTRQGRHRGGAR